MGEIIAHEQLDRSLDVLARRPERFTKSAERLAKEIDAQDIDLEISDPQTWRGEPSTPREGVRVTVENQLRTEIDRIKIMNRDQEMRLARRIEFAKIRLGRAAKEAGLSSEELSSGVSHPTSVFLGSTGQNCSLPPKVCRRWMEWHALRLEMVERNLYLALINVERYAHTTAGRADLIQEGASSLFRAVDGFDWRRGLLFRTYAVHWLNQAFRSYLYNFGSTVRVPVYLQKATKHIGAAIGRLGDPNASSSEISAISGLPANLVTSARAAARTTRSLDAPIGDPEDSASLRDLLAVDVESGPYSTALEDVSLEEGLGEAMGKLSDRERYVLGLRFGIGGEREHTLAEVAKRLGVSLERVRQIQVRAISKMRTARLRKVADPFLN
ncbi:MAG: sigma-70 family RNA polymerase sigma factor [Planctomycetota bacterium]